MPRTVISVREIAGYNPLADSRKSGGHMVIDGQNFTIGLDGVRSDFATKLIDSENVLAANNACCQSVPGIDNDILFVNRTLFSFDPAITGDGLTDLTGFFNGVTLPFSRTTDMLLVPKENRQFTSVYIGGKLYFCSWNNGVYYLNTSNPLGGMTRLTGATVPGFPADASPVLAIGETNGRMIYLTSTTVYWSNAGNPLDLSPALGGAGFQIIGAKIGGEVIGLTTLANGFIVWTSTGALSAEFISGDAVFRWFQIQTSSGPVSQSSICRTPAGETFFVNRFGLFRVAGLNSIQPVDNSFGEFVRDWFSTRITQIPYIWFAACDNRIYISARLDLEAFDDTLMLDLTHGTWGRFNHRHQGMFNYSAEGNNQAFGYLDENGFTCRIMPRHFGLRGREIGPSVYAGLDSWVEIGYLRSEELKAGGDSLQEITEVTIYNGMPKSLTLIERIDEGIWFYADGLGALTTVSDDGVMTEPDYAASYDRENLYKWSVDYSQDDWYFTGSSFATTPGQPDVRGGNTAIAITMYPGSTCQIAQSPVGLTYPGAYTISCKLKATPIGWLGNVAIGIRYYGGAYDPALVVLKPARANDPNRWVELEGTIWLTAPMPFPSSLLGITIYIPATVPGTKVFYVCDMQIRRGYTPGEYISTYDQPAIGEGSLLPNNPDSWLVIDEGILQDDSSLSRGYSLQALSDLNLYDSTTGINYSDGAGTLVYSGINSDTWTCSCTGHYSRIRIGAYKPGEAFAIKAMDVTVAFAGQLT